MQRVMPNFYSALEKGFRDDYEDQMLLFSDECSLNYRVSLLVNVSKPLERSHLIFFK
jgi:hypothetical protein